MRIIHIITNLGEGGAQKVLLNLCNETSQIHENIIISLSDDISQSEIIKNYKFKIYVLQFNQFPLGFIFGIIKLFKILNSKKANIIQTWLYHADLIGSLVAFIIGYRNIIWTIRDCSIDVSTKLSTKIIVYLLAKLSYIIPNKIIYNSSSAFKKFHFIYGYDRRKSFLIRNGFDTNTFKPNIKLRTSLRNELDISDSEKVIGMVARFHPVKNHIYLFKALNLVKIRFPNIKCILVGKDLEKHNSNLIKLISFYQLENNIILLGIRRDICRIMNTIDLNILCSKSEAFPNVIGEAMSCGTPCISTNVGDANDLIGKNGWLVPLDDDHKFSQTIITALTELHLKKSEKAPSFIRNRIVNFFSKEKMINQFVDFWENYNE